MKTYLLQFITLALILLGLSCSSKVDSPENQVKTVLMNIEEAAENRNISQLMQHIDETYSDHHGHDKQAISRFIRFYFISNQNINIFTQLRDITVDGGIATVELSAAMAARGVDLQQASQRLNADLHRFSIVLGKQSNNTDWLVQSVSWQRGW